MGSTNNINNSVTGVSIIDYYYKFPNNLVKSGLWYSNRSQYHNSNAYYWTATGNITYTVIVNTLGGNLTVNDVVTQGSGYSVRCLVGS